MAESGVNAPIGIWPFTQIEKTDEKHRIYTTGFQHPESVDLDIVPNIQERENITIFILVLSGVLMVILVGCCITLMKATDIFFKYNETCPFPNFKFIFHSFFHNSYGTR